MYVKEILLKKLKDAIRKIIKIKKQYDRYMIGVYGAQGAFFMLVSAVPLAMLAVILLGMFAPADLRGISGILSEFFTQRANSYILYILSQLRQRATMPLLSVTMAFLLWAATKGVRSIAEGIGTVYGQRQYTGFEKAVRSGVYSVFMITVSASAAVAVTFAEKYFLRSGVAVVLCRYTVLFCLLAFLFAAAYKFLAKSEIPFKSQLWGASLAAAGWMIYTFGYWVYIRHFSKYSVLYGGFGAVMLFMLWLYIGMNILLCGALFNKLKADRKKCD